MFVDLLNTAGFTETEADLCIVGAGAAGITIAREFARRNVRVVLLEAGGLRREAETQALARGESVGSAYAALDQVRQRYFGGSTNAGCWFGWCRPLAALDFEQRPWAPYSGWPFMRSQLEPWYRRAQAVCEAGPFDYDLESWRGHAAGPMGDLPLSGDTIITLLAQLSPPTRFGLRYRAELAEAESVCVYLHANVTEVVTDGDNSTATRVEATTLDGRRLSVACRFVVLAAGGIENARLLLASRRVDSRGLGNDRDLVGRFFMDHPTFELGFVDLTEGRLLDLYDPYRKFRRRGDAPNGVYAPSLLGASLSIAPEIQRREQILGYHAWIVPTYAFHGSAAGEALRRLHKGLRDSHLPASVRDDLKSVLRRPDHAALSALGRLYPAKGRVRSYRLVNILEPEQLPESRVTLGARLDRLGLPTVRLDWRVGKLVRRTLASAHELLDQELRRTGLGQVREPFLLEQEDRFVRALQWVSHTMGTTRMHADAANGVVDADSRVHSTSNVYVAGSSVFPTAGSDMPTLTIVALALRLAEHLAQRMDTPADD